MSASGPQESRAGHLTEGADLDTYMCAEACVASKLPTRDTPESPHLKLVPGRTGPREQHLSGMAVYKYGVVVVQYSDSRKFWERSKF